MRLLSSCDWGELGCVVHFGGAIVAGQNGTTSSHHAPLLLLGRWPPFRFPALDGFPVSFFLFVSIGCIVADIFGLSAIGCWLNDRSRDRLRVVGLLVKREERNTLQSVCVAAPPRRRIRRRSSRVVAFCSSTTATTLGSFHGGILLMERPPPFLVGAAAFVCFFFALLVTDQQPTTATAAAASTRLDPSSPSRKKNDERMMTREREIQHDVWPRATHPQRKGPTDLPTQLPPLPTHAHTTVHPIQHQATMSLEDGTEFLFTSESVNEGHPGKQARRMQKIPSPGRGPWFDNQCSNKHKQTRSATRSLTPSSTPASRTTRTPAWPAVRGGMNVCIVCMHGRGPVAGT